MELSLRIIAKIKNDFPTKFGIPRQSGLVEELSARVVFEPEYRNAEAVRGLDGFSHIWLIWGFSEARRASWSPTVRPPRLGGNKRMGVFATRSPFRPNPIGLSSVRLCGIETHPELGPVLQIQGADLMDGSPIYDIKPYLAYTDSHGDAADGFAGDVEASKLEVEMSAEGHRLLGEERCRELTGLLRQDPRPSYQEDPERIYGMKFAGFEVKFTVAGSCLRVLKVEKDA